MGLLALIVALVSCHKKGPEIISYDLETRDFIEEIHGIGTLESANNLTIVAPRVYSPLLKVAGLMEEGTMVEVGDTLCKLEASDISGFFYDKIKEYEKAKGDLITQEANNELQMSQLEAQLKENEVKAEASRLDSIQLKFAPTVKRRLLELELKKNQIIRDKILKKVEAQKRINEQSIRALKSQILQKEQQANIYQEQLDKLIVTAPKSGMLVYATSPFVVMISGDGTASSGGKTKIGASVFMDMPLLELPDLDSMQISLMVQEAEYKRIEKGQKVIIKPESSMGLPTTGTVKSKSLASNRMDYNFKVKSYKVIIDIDSLDNQYLPGLSAGCDISIQNIKDTLAVPSISIFEKDSSKIVYVLKDELFEATVIETGTTNGSETIVTSGLAGNETIALREPPFNYILKPKKIQK